MRAAAAWLGARAQLGRELFGRGAPESLKVEDRSGIAADLPALLQAYAAARRRALARRPYAPKPRRLWSVQEALARLILVPSPLGGEGTRPRGSAAPLAGRPGLWSTHRLVCRPVGRKDSP